MRKKSNRKVRPLVNPITLAIEGARVSSPELLNELRMVELMAIDAFAKGHATIKDWHTLRTMSNVAHIMAEHGVGPEVAEVATAAQNELVTAYARYASTGRWGFTGPGLQMIRSLYEFHDLQRSVIARSDYERYLKMLRSYERNPEARREVLKEINMK